MRWQIAIGLAVAACGQADSDVTAQHGRCFALEGKIFTSLTEGECGLTPTGPAHCFWQLEFSANDGDSSTVSWRHSDVGETLRVVCNGAQIATSGSRATTGSYQVATGILTWDGTDYGQ